MAYKLIEGYPEHRTPFQVPLTSTGVNPDQIQACWRYLTKSGTTVKTEGQIEEKISSITAFGAKEGSFLQLAIDAAISYKRLSSSVKTARNQMVMDFNSGLDYTKFTNAFPGFDVITSKAGGGYPPYEFTGYAKKIFHYQLYHECGRWHLDPHTMKGCLLAYLIDVDPGITEVDAIHNMRKFLSYYGRKLTLDSVPTTVITAPQMKVRAGKGGRGKRRRSHRY